MTEVMFFMYRYTKFAYVFAKKPYTFDVTAKFQISSVD